MAERSTTSTPKNGKPPRGWRRRFLAALADAGNVRYACAKAGVDRKTAYNHRNRDPKFSAAWDLALEDACDALELEARRRAMKGVERPVYYKGRKVDAVTEYSDTLTIFLLKAHNPKKFRDNAGDAPASGPAPTPHAIPDDDQRFLAGDERPALEGDP